MYGASGSAWGHKRLIHPLAQPRNNRYSTNKTQLAVSGERFLHGQSGGKTMTVYPVHTSSNLSAQAQRQRVYRFQK